MSRRRREPPPPSLSDVVADLIEPLAEGSADPLRRINLAWSRICGSPLARHLQPLRLEGTTLHVGADGPIWRDAVFHQRAALEGRIRQYVPRVRRIWLHTRPVAPPPTPPSPSARPWTERTEGIEHAGLRSAMEAMLAAAGRPSTPDDG